jgi:hypothetical protein
MALRKFLSIPLVSLVALGGCSAGVETTDENESLEQALENLPEGLDERAAALDDLHSRFAGDPRLDAALRRFEADFTPGLLRRLDMPDGRFVVFVELENGGAMFGEGGPRELPSLVSELGLDDAEPADVWRALLPSEAVPDSVAGTWSENHGGPVIDPSQPKAEPGEAVMQLGQPLASLSDETSDNLGTTREPIILTEDGFIRAGGCAISPTRSGTPFGKQVPHSPMCAPSITGNLAAALVSREMRTHTNVVSGGLVRLQFSLSNSVYAVVDLGVGAWFNSRSIAPSHCETTGGDCIPYVGCFSSTTRCGIIDPALHRVDVLNAGGDGYHIGGTWFNSPDSRADAQPWP